MNRHWITSCLLTVRSYWRYCTDSVWRSPCCRCLAVNDDSLTLKTSCLLSVFSCWQKCTDIRKPPVCYRCLAVEDPGWLPACSSLSSAFFSSRKLHIPFTGCQIPMIELMCIVFSCVQTNDMAANAWDFFFNFYPALGCWYMQRELCEHHQRIRLKVDSRRKFLFAAPGIEPESARLNQATPPPTSNLLRFVDDV